MELKYTEGNHSITIEVEPGDGLAIYQSSVSGWNSPNENDGLSNEDRQRIIHNVCVALDFLKVAYVLA
jgi:hypothetical protein